MKIYYLLFYDNVNNKKSLKQDKTPVNTII